MKGALPYRLLLFILLLAFTVAKLSALQYTFFWDESWSYAPAVKLMYQHGPSLMPGSIDTFYSRGHPLLFYFLAACFMKVFGTSVVAQHAFALAISTLLLWVVWELGRNLYGVRVAFVATVFIGLQVMFFVQSSLLLPEVLVALCVITCIYGYATRRFLIAGTALTLLLFTKESGFTLALAALIYGLLVFRSLGPKERLYLSASLLLPVLCIGVFFLFQKRISGWYLYPEHLGLVNLSKSIVVGKFRYFFEILFVQQYRFIPLTLLVVLCLLNAVTNWSVRRSVLLMLLLPVGYLFIANEWGWIPRWVLAPVFVAGLGIAVISLSASGKEERQKDFLRLLLLFSLVYLVFCSINFFSIRYLITVLVAIGFVFAIAIDHFAIHRPEHFRLIVVAGFLVIALQSVFAFASKDIADTEPGMYDAIKVQKGVVEYFEKHHLYSAHIACSGYQHREHLLHPLTGYRSTADSFLHINTSVDSSTDYIIVDNIEKEASYLQPAAINGFETVEVFTSGKASATIYRRSKR